MGVTFCVYVKVCKPYIYFFLLQTSFVKLQAVISLINGFFTQWWWRFCDTNYSKRVTGLCLQFIMILVVHHKTTLWLYGFCKQWTVRNYSGTRLYIYPLAFYINSSPSNHHLIQPNIKIVLEIVLILGGLFPHLKSYVY